MLDVSSPSDGGVEEVFYRGSEVTSMCPAVAMGIKVAQSGQLSEEAVATIRKVSDLMTQLAQEERDERLAVLDRQIAAAKTARRTEAE